MFNECGRRISTSRPATCGATTTLEFFRCRAPADFHGRRWRRIASGIRCISCSAAARSGRLIQLAVCSLELLENAVFCFASRIRLEYPMAIPPASLPVHDRLFLQRPQRPRRAPRGECGPVAAAYARSGLRLFGLQSTVRPVRSHHQANHGRGAWSLCEVLLLGLSAQPCQYRGRYRARVCASRFVIFSTVADVSTGVVLARRMI
jgi:hypothetical protein